MIDYGILTRTRPQLAPPYLLKRLPLAESSGHPSIQVVEVLGEIEFKNIMFMRYSTRQELLHDYEALHQQGSHLKSLIKSRTKQRFNQRTSS